MERSKPPVPEASLEPWRVREEDFPADGSEEDRLRFMVRYALLAPSSHNSQPWLFRLRDGAVHLETDRSRALPVVDPEDRELVISCGAALYHLRVALRYFGYFGDVRTLEPPETFNALGLRSVPDRLARVRLGEPHRTTDLDRRLFRAIPARHTNRRPFADRPIPASIVADLTESAESEGAWVRPADTAEQREALADLVALADREQWANPSFRRELASWLHPNRTRSRDGMPGYAFGMSTIESLVGPLVVRTFDRGDGQAARSRELAEGSPALVVLGTTSDHPSAWLDAGQALAALLLRATDGGVGTSYLNQPLELAALRPRATEIVGGSGHAQLILRLGYADPAPATPRRSLEEVLAS